MQKLLIIGLLIFSTVFITGCINKQKPKTQVDYIIEKETGKTVDQILAEQKKLNPPVSQNFTGDPESGQFSNIDANKKLYDNKKSNYSLQLPKELNAIWERNFPEDRTLGTKHAKYFSTTQGLNPVDLISEKNAFSIVIEIFTNGPDTFEEWLALYGYVYEEELEIITVNGMNAVKMSKISDYENSIQIAIHKDNRIVQITFYPKTKEAFEKYNTLYNETFELIQSTFTLN